MKGKKYIGILVLIVLSITIFSGCTLLNKNNQLKQNNTEINEKNNQEEIISSEIKEDKITNITIAAIGDILIHKEILDTQYNMEDDSYDFKNTLQYVKNYLSNVDLTIANLEGTLSGKENYGFSGYPSFNAPDELADAMKWAGIDVVNNMNNHSLDRDVKGFYRTREVLEDKEFDVIGTRGSEDQDRYIIKDVKGINVGITSYSYTMTCEGGVKGLNGIPISSEVFPLMNTFRDDTLEEDFQNMKEQIDKIKAERAETIIF